MAEDIPFPVSELQASADTAIEQLGNPRDDGWEVAEWTSDDLRTKYALGRHIVNGPYNLYCLQVAEAEAPDGPECSVSMFRYENVKNEIHVRGAAEADLMLLDPSERDAAASCVLIGHLATAPVVIMQEAPKLLEYSKGNTDPFVELQIEAAASDATVQSLAKLLQQLDSDTLSGDTLWEMAEEMKQQVSKKYGFADSAIYAALSRSESLMAASA